MIRTTYDPDADAMFIRFAADGVISVRTEETAPGVMLDYDKDGALIAIEVLDVRERDARHAAAA
jgi:uncharacterized protein YuzE